MKTLSLFLSCLFAAAVLGATAAAAQDGDYFRSNAEIGDGKNGNVFNKWSQGIPERVVERVIATVERTRGGDGAYVNLRFGSGATFENAKRAPVRPGQQDISWNVGAAPGGQPLVLQAYDGTVRVIGVRVLYQRSDRPQGNDRRPPPDNRRDDYRDDGRRDDRGDGRYDDRYDNGGDSRYDNSRGDNSRGGEASGACARGRYAPPKIELGYAEPTGGLFSGKYRLRGSLFGSCVEEFGYFERGKLKEKIAFPYDERFQRQDFEIRVQSGRDGELRAYSSNGGRDSIPVDAVVQQGSGAPQQPPFGLN